MEAKKSNKFIDFMRRYGAYIFAGILIVVIGVSLGVVYSHNSNQSVVDVSNDDKNKDDDKGNQTPDKEPDDKEPDDKDPGKTDEPVDADPLKFGLPMQNATIIKDFTDKKLIYNATLDRWEAHFYIDMTSSDLNVYSVLDGKVLSVDYDYLTGYVVKVQHDDGFVSCYASLNDKVLVKAGDTVKKGDKLGTASSMASASSKYGDHLEFTLLKDNKKVDPNNYLDLQNK